MTDGTIGSTARPASRSDAHEWGSSRWRSGPDFVGLEEGRKHFLRVGPASDRAWLGGTIVSLRRPALADVFVSADPHLPASVRTAPVARASTVEECTGAYARYPVRRGPGSGRYSLGGRCLPSSRLAYRPRPKNQRGASSVPIRIAPCAGGSVREAAATTGNIACHDVATPASGLTADGWPRRRPGARARTAGAIRS